MWAVCGPFVGDNETVVVMPRPTAIGDDLLDRLAKELLVVRRRSKRGLTASCFKEADTFRALPVVAAQAQTGRQGTDDVARQVLLKAISELPDPSDKAAIIFFGADSDNVTVALQRRNEFVAGKLGEASDDWRYTKRWEEFTREVARAVLDIDNREDDRPAQEPSYDPSADGSYQITCWSPTAPPDFAIEGGSRPRQRWVNATDHARRVRAFPKGVQNDPLAYLVDFEIDHREGPGSGQFRMKLAKGTYAEQMATIDCLRDDAKARRAVRRALHEGEFREFASTAPPASVAAMVVITAPDGRFLAVQRSRAVQYERLHWMVGITELMKPYAKEQKEFCDQDFSQVVARAIEEELGLKESETEFTDPFVSWIGYWAPSACVNFVAHVKVNIEPEEIEGRRDRSPDSRETERCEWLPLNEATVGPIMTKSGRDRKWTIHSRLMIKEMIRHRDSMARLRDRSLAT